MTHSFPTRRSSDLVGKLVETSSRSRYVARLAEGSRNVAMPSKLEAYAKQHLTPQSRKPIDQAIAKIRESIEKQGRIKSGVTAWLVTAVKYPARSILVHRRSDARRVGQECVSKCSFQGWQDRLKK